MMTTMSSQLRLYLEGPDLPDPAHLGLGELAKLLGKLYEVIVTLAEETKSPLPEDQGSEGLASLVKIEKGSVIFNIAYASTLQLHETLIQPTLEGHWDRIPPRTYNRMYELSRDLLNKDRSLKLGPSQPWIGAERPVPLKPRRVSVQDTLTLYGKVIRLGGVTPKVDLRVGDEEYHIEADEQEIKRLEEKGALYQIVGLQVKAQLRLEEGSWQVDRKTLKLLKVLPYTQENPAQALRRLAELTAEYWSEVDPAEHVKKLRG